MYKRIFKESEEANNASLAINYIIARHGRNIKSAKEIMIKLKKNLKDKAYNYLKKFGDPDASGKYSEVIKKWDEYLKSLTKQKESTLISYKRIFKEADWETISKTRRMSRGEPLLVEASLYEVFLKSDSRRPGYFVVTVYQGKSLKPYANYTYQNMQKAGKAIDDYVQTIKEYKASRDKWKQTTKVQAKTSFEKIQSGDIFNTSWGYDQTNVEFYQVIEKKGTSTVIVREIGREPVGSGYSDMAGMFRPIKDNFISQPFATRMTPHGIKVGHQIASPYTGGDEGTYVSWYA
jgi:hypothetical protein